MRKIQEMMPLRSIAIATDGESNFTPHYGGSKRVLNGSEVWALFCAFQSKTV